jgi:hypothetical protein
LRCSSREVHKQLAAALMIDDFWYKNAIIYCLDIEKYADGNGDGVGDFVRLARRLDYLRGLGVPARRPTRCGVLALNPQQDDDGSYRSHRGARRSRGAGKVWISPTTRLSIAVCRSITRAVVTPLPASAPRGS